MVLVTSFQTKKKQRFLFFFLGIAIFGMVFTLWYKFLNKKPSSVHVLPQKPAEIKINFDILKSPILTELQPFERIVPFENEAGRQNPFIPY